MPVLIPEEVRFDLRSASSHAFEIVCHQYLRIFLPGLVHARSMGEADVDRVDLFTSSEHDDLDEAIQCKGFERPFNLEHLRLCRNSIDKFKASGRHTRSYRLVINGFLRE